MKKGGFVSHMMYDKKVKGYKADRINFLSVKLHINNKEKLLRRIKDLYDKDI